MLGDILGRKRIMLAGVAIFCAGSVVAALASNVDWLIVGRVIMGVGAAASEPGTLSIIRHVYPDRETRADALGVWAAVSGLALALGPVIGGALVGFSSWRAIFWFNLGFGVRRVRVGRWSSCPSPPTARAVASTCSGSSSAPRSWPACRSP